LDHAVKIRSVPLTHDRYTEAAGILHEVMAIMPPLPSETDFNCSDSCEIGG
ncbi:hypothetical protein U1Q18_002629, partial [Sarracenia purpurea var. burkii]